MARANAAMPMLPMVAPMPAMKTAKMSAKQPHGMSLAVKPERTPHATAKGRDVHGRMLPGQLPANAAPPFHPVATVKPAATAKAATMPLSLGRIPGRSRY